MTEDGDPRCPVCNEPVRLEGCHAFYCPNCKRRFEDGDDE
jgi:tRNA(Ile2) C34 agmatinyltransferase TiaS